MLKHTVIKGKDSVAVIVFADQHRVALLKQFRSTTGRFYYELPAGLIEEGESLLEAARREVKEETGIIVSNLRQVSFGPNLLDPSKSNEDFGVAVGTAFCQSSRKLDDNEVISSEITWMSLYEVYERLRAQMNRGTPFKDGLFMSGHSLYAFLAYKFTQE